MEKFEFKGTEGKWIIEDAYLYGLPQLHKHVTVEGRFTNAPIATCYSEWLDKSEMMANLSLICAAPLLLSALIDLVGTAQKLWDEVKPIKETDIMQATHPVIEEAKAAIQAAISQPENVKP